MRRDLNPTPNRHSSQNGPIGSLRNRSVDTNMRFPLPVIGNPRFASLLAMMALVFSTAFLAAPEARAQSAQDCAICTQDKAKVTSLTFRYNGTSAQFVLVQDKDNVNTYFADTVQPGEEFVVNGTDTDGKFHKNDLDIVILSSDPGMPYTASYDGANEDVITVHVSCSKPLFYGMDLAEQEGKEDPNPEDIGKFTLVGGLDTAGDEICTPADPEDAFCYLVADNDGLSGSLDGFSFLSGDFAETAIGLTGTDHIEGITRVPSTNTLYGADADAFGTIDINTGVFTQIGLFGSGNGAQGVIDFIDVDGLAWDPFEQIMYASVRRDNGPDDLLIQVDITTGQHIPGAFDGDDYVVVEKINGLDDIDDIAISTMDGQMYAIQNEDGQDSRLILINKQTGATTDFGDLDVPNVEGIGFHPDGRLLGVNGDSFRSVMQIPLEPFTGVTIPISDLGVNSWLDYESIACLTEDDNRIEGSVIIDPSLIDLNLIKSADVTPGQDADDIEYTITVTNDNSNPVAGPNATTGVAAAGVSVVLYRDFGTIGVYDDGVDVYVADVVTAGDGSYAFDVSATGNFIVRVDLSSIVNNAYEPTDNEEAVSFAGYGETSTGNDFAFFTFTDATNVSVNDYFPAGATFASASSSQGSFDDGTMTWDVGTLAPGASATLTLNASFDGYGSLENCAEVMTADQDDIDSTPGNGTENDEDDADCTTVIRDGIDLELDKAADGPTDGQITYTISVFNNDANATVAATGVEVSDELPAGVSFVSASASQGSYSNGTWTVGTIELGATATLTLVADVLNASDMRNCAEVSAANEPDVDSTPGNGTEAGEDDDDCAPTTDIAECKIEGDLIGQEGAQVVVDGQLVTFSNWVLKDGETDEWVGFDIDVDGLTFYVKAGTQVYEGTGTSWLHPDGLTGMGISNVDFRCDGGDYVIDLELDKAFEGPADGQITYTIDLFNNDANATTDATGITVQDVLPAGASFASSSATLGSYDNNTGIWTVGSLAPGASASLDIIANVTDANDLDNCAEVMTANEDDVDSTPGNDSANEDDDDCVDVPNEDPNVDIEVDKTASTLNPAFGESFTYTITVSNNGPADATNLVVTENLPAGVTYISHVTSAGTWNDGTGLWTLASLAAGDSQTLVITVKIDGASASLGDGQYVLHNHPGNDMAPPGFGLRLDELFGGLKGITFDFDHPDSEVIMTVNGDDITIDGVVYGGHDVGGSYDPASEGLWDLHFEYSNVVSSVPGDDDLYVDDSNAEVSTGTISPQYDTAWFSAGDVYDLGDKSDGSYSFRLGDDDDDNGYNGYNGISGWGWVTHGQNGNLVHAPISDWVFTAAPMNNTVVNCAELTSVSETDTDSVPADGEGDDYDCVTVTPGDPVIDLDLEKSVDQTDASVNDIIHYTLTVSNDAAAGATATNVLIQDVLPAELQFLQSNPASNVTFDNGSNTLSWLITSLAPGASMVLDIEARILEDGSIHNCAEVMDADQNDLDDIYGDGTGEDFDCATTTTDEPFIDLFVDKTAFPTNPGLGDVVDYTITVRNDAGATQTAFGIQVVDTMPAGMSIQSTNPTSNVSVNTTTNLVSWFIPSLAPGEEVVLHIYGQVNEPGEWVNCAEIMAATGNPLDSTFGNGTGQDIDCATTTTPDPTIDLSLVKTVSNATPAVGDQITYTLTLTNSNDALEDATGVVVEDFLPAGVSVVPGYSQYEVTVNPNGHIVWEAGTLEIGEVEIIDIPVIVNANAMQQNCAQITAADQDDVDSTPDNGYGNGEDDESCVTITPNLNPPNLVCYVVPDNESHSGSPDYLNYFTSTGTEISLGLTGTANINAMEFVGASNRLFVADMGWFGTLNPSNGVFSPIGEFGSGQGSLGGKTFSDVSGLALDPFTGYLYATVRKTGVDLLIRVNPLTGQAVTNAFGTNMTYVVIPAVSGADEVDDIAIHPTTGVMYGVVNGGGVSRLITIDKETGASTPVAVIDVTTVRGLAFTADGDLYGTLGSTTNEVRHIDLSTGATTLVTTLGLNGAFDYEAISCNINVPNTLSGTVYLDNNEDAELNSGDVGQAGVTVELWKDNNSDGVVNGGDVPVGTLVTDADGFYAFHVLTPGSYVIQTDLGTYPAGASLTTDNIETAVFPGQGDSDTGNDFGFTLEPVVLGSIGDEVFVDENANGLRDPGEGGLTGILVRLYGGACPRSGTPLATRVSNLTGGYDFTMLPAGTYCVDVDNATVPSGYALTTANDPMTVVIGNGEDFNLADFGFYFDPQAVEADLELTKEVDTSSPALDGVVEFTITVTNNGPANATGLIVRDIIPVGLVFQDYDSSRGTYEANKLGYWTIGDLAVGQTETLKIRTKVVITNMIENIAQVSHVDQEDPDSTPGNGVPSEDDQDNAIVESRGPGSVGDIIAVECADMGTVNALQYSTYDGQIYSGTEVGTVHISNDGGQNWPAFLNTDNEAPVRDIVLDGNGWVYVGSFGSGVYRSTNSGDDWTNIGPVGGSINDLDIDNNSNTAYAAAHGEVLRLNGLSWETVGASSNPFAGDQVLAVVYQEYNNTLLATSAASGTWIFQGGVWSSADTGLPTGKVNVLFRSPDGIILAGHNNDGVYMWGGSSWMPLGTGLENEPIESIGSGPNGEVLAGSRETGAYFQNKITGEWLSIGNLPVFTVSAMTAGSLGEVYAGAPGEGIYVINDTDFDGIPDIAYQVANFMTSAIIQDLVVAPNGDMWAATYGYGILYSSDGGNCWTRMNRGLENLWTFAIERRSDGWLYIGIWADGLGGIWRSKDDGRNWEFLAYPHRQIISLAVDPVNEDIIYAGANISGEGALFRSMDGGDTWSEVGNFIYPVWSITIDPNDHEHVYVGTMGAGIFESFDQGMTFDEVGSPTNGLDNPYVFDMVYAPYGTPYAGQLFAATDAGVYRYDAWAGTWALFGEHSEDFQFRTIAFSGMEIFGGTWNAGVIQYNALSNEWIDFGLSDMPVIAFAMHEQSETLVIGTSGNGVFLAQNMRMSTDTEDETGSVLPDAFALQQNYPNPFNPQTSIPFDLRETAHVKIAVYDMLGRQLGLLVDGTLQAGSHQVTWEAGDVPSGTYLVRMDAGGKTFTQTMILLK